MSSPLLKVILGAGALFSASSAHAVIYGGIDFPDGAISFADSVVSYLPLLNGGPGPTDPNFTNPAQAIGIPNYNGTGSVSLGAGGQITLQFTDNYLTGSNSTAKDLHIFEVGPQVEDTVVEISTNGTTWFSVGTVTGATSSVDIDAFVPYNSANLFSYVRLTDVKALDGVTGVTVGADIDAVGAITTVFRPPTSVPDSGSTLLLAAISLLGMLGLRRRFRS